MTQSKLQIGLICIAVVLLSLTLYVGYFVPIYFDEVFWKLCSARYWLDGGETIFPLSQCKNEIGTKIPWILMPRFWFEGFFYRGFSDLMEMRWFGIGQFLLWLVLFAMLCQRISKRSKTSAFNLFLLGIFLLFWGTLPFGLIENRPEQYLLICLTLFLYFPLFGATTPTHRFFLLFSILLTSAFFFATHPKALLFLPLVVASTSFLKIKKFQKACAFLFILVAAGYGFLFWTKATECPLIRPIADFNRTQMLSPADFLKSPVATTKQALQNLLNLRTYGYNLLFQKCDVSGCWLAPTGDLSIWLIQLNRALRLVAFTMISLWIGLLCITLKSKKKRAFSDYPFVASLSVFIGIAAMAVLQSRKHPYEGHLIFPLVMMAVILLGAGRLNFQPGWGAKAKSLVLPLLSLIGMANIYALFYIYYPFAQTTWKVGGPVENQERSYSGFQIAELRKRINHLAEKCGIRNDQSTRHLVVDDLTAPYFWKTYRPLYWAVGWHNPDLLGYLRKMKSSGVILECRNLDEQVAKISIKDGTLCCHPAF